MHALVKTHLFALKGGSDLSLAESCFALGYLQPSKSQSRLPRAAGNKQNLGARPGSCSLHHRQRKKRAVEPVSPPAERSCPLRATCPGGPPRPPARRPRGLPATLSGALWVGPRGWRSRGPECWAGVLGGGCEPAGRRAGPAGDARRVAVTGHRAFAPRARPLSIHCEVLD